jgi:hypothetical protein
MFLFVECVRKVAVHLGYGTLQCIVIAHCTIQRNGQQKSIILYSI